MLFCSVWQLRVIGCAARSIRQQSNLYLFACLIDKLYTSSARVQLLPLFADSAFYSYKNMIKSDLFFSLSHCIFYDCAPLIRQCVHIPGLGFRRGSYRCECKDGFYFPDRDAPWKFYNGTVIEEEYEKKLMVRVFNSNWFSQVEFYKV